eukprot:TRINITY_DN2416_c0_g3_i1.p1 TRINITY_DN2416_c0_g3~~TRINITY_DN2416_c0_g3_i1.p1  ORF type:complete len:245 (-),score=55.90 TRINITY_DN2416_c0_g3_i1:17-751(-)
MGSYFSAADEADLEAAGPKVVDDPGVELHGATLRGDPCTCKLPPYSKTRLHQEDQSFMDGLDIFTVKALINHKEEGEREFDENYQHVSRVKDNIDRELAKVLAAYNQVSMRRQDLERAFQDAAYVHHSQCQPLKKELGLYAPCQDIFKETLEAYRKQMRKPTCAVGASLPLAPAGISLPAALAAAAVSPPGAPRPTGDSERQPSPGAPRGARRFSSSSSSSSASLVAKRRCGRSRAERSDAEFI